MNVQGLSHGAHPTWTTQATQGTCLSLDDERAEHQRELSFCRPPLDQVDDGHFPQSRVFDREVVPVETKKVPHCLEGGALVPLFEGMGKHNTGKQSDRKDNDILFTVSERVLWARQRALEQSLVSKKVPFAGFFDFKPIVFDHRFDRQPPRLIWQGPLAALETAR